MARVQLLHKQISRIHKDHAEEDDRKKKKKTKSKIKKDTTDHYISTTGLKVDTAIKKKQQAKPGRKTVSRDTPPHRTSAFRGVTRHRWTGRYEAHLWDKNCWNQSQNKKGKQVYLGAYDDEEAAAHAYDLAALKYWGPQTILNFPLVTYEVELKDMEDQSREEYIGSLRRKSSGFSRGVSKYRGVARHHHNGRWEARIGRVLGNKYLYLGTFATQEEAATAYDMAAIEYRGLNAVTNFNHSRYTKWLSCSHHEENAHKIDNKFMSPSLHHQAADSSMLTFPAASPSDKCSTENADEVGPVRHGRDTVAASSSSPSLGNFNGLLENKPCLDYSDTTTTSAAAATTSSGNDDDSKSSYTMSSKKFFPDDIQTFFECAQQESGFSMIADANDHLIHIGTEDLMFGEAELNSFASSIFSFDQLYGSLSL